MRSSEQDRATREKSTLTDLHMLRRCVGFSWAKPLCYEKINASPCVHSVIPHAGSTFPCFRVIRGLQNPPLIRGVK